MCTAAFHPQTLKLEVQDSITHTGKGFCWLHTRILSIHSNDVFIFY